jgi:hypothetical protein
MLLSLKGYCCLFLFIFSKHHSFIGKITREFSTKDMGSLSYFLVLGAHQHPSSLFLSQIKYAHDILQRAQLLDCKPVGNPMVIAHHLSSTGSDFHDLSIILVSCWCTSIPHNHKTKYCSSLLLVN